MSKTETGYRSTVGGILTPGQILEGDSWERRAERLEQLIKAQAKEPRPEGRGESPENIRLSAPMSWDILDIQKQDSTSSRYEKPPSTRSHVSDRREGTYDRAVFLANGPRSDLPLMGKPIPTTKQIQRISVDSKGNQARDMITVKAFEEPAPTPTHPSIDLAGIYNVYSERPEPAPPRQVDLGPGEASRGKLVTDIEVNAALTGAVTDLKDVLQRVMGKK